MAAAFSAAVCGYPSTRSCPRSSFLSSFDPSTCQLLLTRNSSLVLPISPRIARNGARRVSTPRASVPDLNAHNSSARFKEQLSPSATAAEIATNSKDVVVQRRRRVICAAARDGDKKGDGGAARMVMVLGKGGSGKTTASVLLAQRYASAGYRTCLVVQSQDRVADRLLGLRLTPAPQPVPVPAAAAAAAAAGAAGSTNSLLCALRVETTKLLLAPLEIVKKADERLGITQGALAEVVGEELSVLPGMDAVMAVAVLERIARPAGGLLAFAGGKPAGGKAAGGKAAASAGGKAASAGGEWVYPWGEGEAEVVVFDGPTTWEVLRMLAGPERSRWYLRRFRSLAERTDIGRVALPSLARLLDSIVGSSKGGSGGGGTAGGGSSGEDSQRSTAAIWESLDSILTKAVTAFADPYRTSVFLLADASSHSSVDTCRRIWGCAVQAGASPSGVLLLPSPSSSSADSPGKSPEGSLAEKFSPLPVAELPEVPEETPAAVAAASGNMSDAAMAIMNGEGAGKVPRAVEIDMAAGTVRLFLPGFDKQEVKLQQWKGGAELLVEAGDQRRCVELPKGIQGKVTGAKFDPAGFLIITLKPSAK